MLSFQLLLLQLLAVIGPPVKATKCLESSFATAADVYQFWLAVQATFYDVSQKNSVKLPVPVLENIHCLCNYRFNQMINEGLSDIFITAYFLVPTTWNAAILKNINPLAISPIRIHTSTSGHAHASVDSDTDGTKVLTCIGKFLVSQLQIEYELKGGDICGLDAGVALVKLNEQIIAYAKQAWPFNRVLTDKANVVKYWHKFLDHDNADILMYFAVKLFDITVNSMADERMASTITWLNSMLCSSQKSSTLVSQVQVRQWALMDPKHDLVPPFDEDEQQWNWALPISHLNEPCIEWVEETVGDGSDKTENEMSGSGVSNSLLEGPPVEARKHPFEEIFASFFNIMSGAVACERPMVMKANNAVICTWSSANATCPVQDEEMQCKPDPALLDDVTA
ncbi:hypothetical protein BDR06DRAFT_1006648 [Suillus hirtellus]|nr:hypothetical protein BDR06DRAFT_1006648 [Suillus hirtellus]